MQLIINIVITTSLYSIIGISFLHIYRTTHFLNISHAVTIVSAPYVTLVLISKFNLTLISSIPLAIMIVNLWYIALLQYIFFPLKKTVKHNWQLLIASLGVYFILQNVISLYFGDNIESFRTWEVKEGYQFLGAYITNVQIITIIVSIGLLILSYFFIERTTIGKQIKAVSSNPSLSAIFGISTNKAILYSVALGSALASVAGILIAADTDMTPTMGFNWLLYAVVAMIIGGMGKMRYLFMGALLLATAQHLSAYYIDSKWMNATAYLILIVFLYFKPYGFSGKKLKKAKL